jgi:hypothetical protein
MPSAWPCTSLGVVSSGEPGGEPSSAHAGSHPAGVASTRVGHGAGPRQGHVQHCQLLAWPLIGNGSTVGAMQARGCTVPRASRVYFMSAIYGIGVPVRSFAFMIAKLGLMAEQWSLDQYKSMCRMGLSCVVPLYPGSPAPWWIGAQGGSRPGGAHGPC